MKISRPPENPDTQKTESALSKREFMQQYVLNRSNTCPAGLSGDSAAQTAARAWEVIERECGK